MISKTGRIVFSALVISLAAALVGTTVAKAATSVDKVSVEVFQAAGSVGGGVLTEGDEFAPTSAAVATLQRKDTQVKYVLNTSGLPPGAYTNWWVVFRYPENCTGECDEFDLLDNAVGASVFWSTGGVVASNGQGHFQDTYVLGDDRGYSGTQNIIDRGGFDPHTAEIHIIVKYHGPVSDNPDTLYGQTHTLLGSCDVGANALDLGAPFGVQCFDPQVAVFKP